jgi:hypothetical protein
VSLTQACPELKPRSVPGLSAKGELTPDELKILVVLPDLLRLLNKRDGDGQNVIRHYTLNTMPLLVRAGSIVPMGPVVQYATEKFGCARRNEREDRSYEVSNMLIRFAAQ